MQIFNSNLLVWLLLYSKLTLIEIFQVLLIFASVRHAILTKILSVICFPLKEKYMNCNLSLHKSLKGWEHLWPNTCMELHYYSKNKTFGCEQLLYSRCSYIVFTSPWVTELSLHEPSKLLSGIQGSVKNSCYHGSPCIAI